MIQKKRDIAEKKAAMLQKLQGSLEEVAQLHVDLSLAISEVENELESISADCTTMHAVSDEDFVIQTKCGRKYWLAIRKLLLDDQVPTSKIADIIKSYKI